MIQKLNDEDEYMVGDLKVIAGVDDDIALDIAKDIGTVYSVVTGDRDSENKPIDFSSKLCFIDVSDEPDACIIWHKCTDGKIGKMSIEDGVDTYIHLLETHVNDDGVQARDMDKTLRKIYSL